MRLVADDVSKHLEAHAPGAGGGVHAHVPAHERWDTWRRDFMDENLQAVYMRACEPVIYTILV